MQATLLTPDADAMKKMSEVITLDNGSTMSIFCNPNLVTNIHEADITLELLTNAGSKKTRQQAYVPDFGKVWFDDQAIANIFGFKYLVKFHRITYDSAKEDAFLIHAPGGIIRFKATEDGLYQYQVSDKYKHD